MSCKYKRVLVVDDDLISLQVLHAFFAKCGVEHLHGAENGAQAAAVLRTHGDIDLIICDLHMPDVDGIEFMNLMVTNGVAADLVIVSSASQTIRESAALLAKVNRLNCKGVLGKPVVFEKLAGLLELTLPA